MPEKTEAYHIRLHMLSSHVDILSPIDTKAFYTELSESLRKRGSDPNWVSWYMFRKKDDKLIAINIMHVVGVEEL